MEKIWTCPMNYLLHMGIMLTKVFIILFLLVRIGNMLQIFKVNLQAEGCKKGNHVVRLPKRALGWHKRWKSLSFCKIWNNPTPSLFFNRPRYNKHCRTWRCMTNLSVKWMNEWKNIYFTTMDVLQCVYIPILHLCFPWDCKEKNCRICSRGSVM